MKSISLSACVLTVAVVLPLSAGAQTIGDANLFSTQVAQSGCCKARQSDKHPWVRNGMGYQQCEDINRSDGDKIFKKSGNYWWDRSC